MANVTDATGVFIFDFTNTGKTAQEVIDWLTRFDDALSSLGYPTYLGFNESDHEAVKKDMGASLQFSGAGRWTYEENIKVFANLDGDEDYQNLLKEMNGLTIKIEYEEYDNDFEGNGYATITIQDGKATLDGEFFGDDLSHNDDDDDWDDEFDDDDDDW